MLGGLRLWCVVHESPQSFRIPDPPPALPVQQQGEDVRPDGPDAPQEADLGVPRGAKHQQRDEGGREGGKSVERGQGRAGAEGVGLAGEGGDEAEGDEASEERRRDGARRRQDGEEAVDAGLAWSRRAHESL